MINVEAEVSKHKYCKDRDELGRIIKDYKNLAIQVAAKDLIAAGQYNAVVLRLQEICDKLPAPRIKIITGSEHNTPVKTATISKEEEAKINAAWRKKAKK